jgi:hypothetical protein
MGLRHSAHVIFRLNGSKRDIKKLIDTTFIEWLQKTLRHFFYFDGTPVLLKSPDFDKN